MNHTLYGVITASRPPNHPLNINGYQYEYDVDCNGDVGTKIPVKFVVRGDGFGDLDQYDDVTLRVGARVLVWFPNDRFQNGIILTCLRNNATVMQTSDGRYWRRRFNTVEQSVDQQGGWQIKLDQGELLRVDRDLMTIDDGNGQSIVLNRAQQSITLHSGADWNVQIGGDVNLTVTGNLNATVDGDLNATVEGDGTADITGDLKVNCDNATIEASTSATVKTADADIEATGTVTIKGAEIDLNEATSPITTVLNHSGVIDLITCVPVQGVGTIKAG